MAITATKINQKKCLMCRSTKAISKNFYKSESPLNPDGYVGICTSCIKANVLNENGTVNEAKLKQICMRIDKPYYSDDLNSAFLQVKKESSFLSDDEVAKSGDKIVGIYFKNIGSLRQCKSKSYSDSEAEGFAHSKVNYEQKAKREEIENRDVPSKDAPKKEQPVYADGEKFKVTDSMIDLFGDGYTPSIYKKMYEKYEKLKINYTLQTNIHQEALATYVRFKVQEELATARGDVAEAKKWYDAANTAAESGKLQAKQLSKADLEGGVNSISELTKALEQAVDVIKILPRFKYRPNDAPDFNIWCYVNYERRLNDKPLASYEDVYSFYDKRKMDYINQNGDPYGIFTNDTTEKNRDTVKTFITLPDDYDDMAGGDDD